MSTCAHARALTRRVHCPITAGAALLTLAALLSGCVLAPRGTQRERDRLAAAGAPYEAAADERVVPPLPARARLARPAAPRLPQQRRPRGGVLRVGGGAAAPQHRGRLSQHQRLGRVRVPLLGRQPEGLGPHHAHVRLRPDAEPVVPDQGAGRRPRRLRGRPRRRPALRGGEVPAAARRCWRRGSTTRCSPSRCGCRTRRSGCCGWPPRRRRRASQTGLRQQDLLGAEVERRRAEDDLRTLEARAAAAARAAERPDRPRPPTHRSHRPPRCPTRARCRRAMPSSSPSPPTATPSSPRWRTTSPAAPTRSTSPASSTFPTSTRSSASRAASPRWSAPRSPSRR